PRGQYRLRRGRTCRAVLDPARRTRGARFPRPRPRPRRRRDARAGRAARLVVAFRTLPVASRRPRARGGVGLRVRRHGCSRTDRRGRPLRPGRDHVRGEDDRGQASSLPRTSARHVRTGQPRTGPWRNVPVTQQTQSPPSLPSSPAMVPVAYRVVRAGDETHDTVSIEVEPAADAALPPFGAGQFAMVYAFGIGDIPISV